MTKMNKEERIKMVKAMEFVARQINDEDVFMGWLMNGVADGDIAYGDLGTTENIEDVDYYIDDEPFAQLMGCFLRCMASAKRSGGLYCDGICDQN